MSGRFGKADLAANTDTDLFTVPAGKVATVNIRLANRGDVAVKARIAIRDGAITNADYLDYDVIVPAFGVLDETGIAMSAGETVTVRADVATVSARAHGFVEGVV